jgi:hypothetical protein
MEGYAMSAEQPDALALLDIARETLLGQVLPQLDGDARYQALMIANAMAMAIRELTPGAVDHELEAQLLRDLYGHLQVSDDEDAERTSERLEDRFARDLRSGEFDGDRQQLVRQLLRARVEARLQVSNPRRWAREVNPAADPVLVAGTEGAPASGGDVD